MDQQQQEQGWTTAGRLGLMLGLLSCVLMLGLPQLDYGDEVRSRIVEIIGAVALSASGYIFGRKK